MRRQRRGEQPRKLTGRNTPGSLQSLGELTEHICFANLTCELQHAGNDFQRQSGRGFERLQIQLQRAARIMRQLCHAGRENLRPGEIDIVRTCLPQKCTGAFGISLQQRVLSQLAQIMRGDAATLLLYRKRQLVKDLESIGPLALGFVDAYQMVQRRPAILAGGCQLLE